MSGPALPSALTDAAVAMAADYGWPVFPCKADKTPATMRGFKDASHHPVHVSLMFEHAAMIGVPTGRDTFVAIDVDAKGDPSGMAWLEANRYRLPRTREHRTGSGGLHLLFKHPSGGPDIRNSASALAPHVDVRGVGGYVIAPPSPGYIVVDDAAIAPMPDWLVQSCLAKKGREHRSSGIPAGIPPDAASAPPEPVSFDPACISTAYGLAALEAECDAVRSAPFGRQEHTLNVAALKIGALVAGGELNGNEASAALIAAGGVMPCGPGREPWTAREIADKVRRGTGDGARTPRRSPNDPARDSPEVRDFVERMTRRTAAGDAPTVSRLQAGIRDVLARAMVRDPATRQAVLGRYRAQFEADRARHIAELRARA